MVIGMTLVFEVTNYFLNALILEIPIEIEAFSKILLVEVIYNTILTIIYKIRSIIRKTIQRKKYINKIFLERR